MKKTKKHNKKINKKNDIKLYLNYNIQKNGNNE